MANPELCLMNQSKHVNAEALKKNNCVIKASDLRPHKDAMIGSLQLYGKTMWFDRGKGMAACQELVRNTYENMWRKSMEMIFNTNDSAY